MGILFLLFLIGALATLILFVIWIIMRAFQSAIGPAAPHPHQPASRHRRLPVNGKALGRDTSAACPECGAPLAADAPEGLCPRCLLKPLLNTPMPTPSGVSPGHAAFVAPDPAELAPHFPQLEILGLLGQGGMGAVYKARQLKLDRCVALKVLPEEWGRDPAFAERFQREARALARLTHPHIVAVHDFGEAGGHFYLLMEFVDGANLRQLLQAGPLEPRLALQVIPQICDALQYAHEEGVVHRDIKPENILIDARGRVRIADFGLAKLVGPSRATFTLTGTHQVMGTLDYMAPEQRSRPQDVDHRADIYSLGVVLYEMLTGELPLGRFTPPSQVSGMDGRIDEVVYRALEREPDRRYQHVSEVRSEVEAISGGVAAPASPPVLGWGSPAAFVPEDLQLRVHGPAAVLVISALVAVLQWGADLFIVFGYFPGLPGIPDGVFIAVGGWFIVVLILAGVIVAAAVRLRQFDSYGLVISGIIVAMLPWSIHCLIGVPAGAWAFYVLSRPDVRAAFAANLRRRQTPARPTPRPGSKPHPPRPTGPVQRQARSFWRALVSVFVSNPRREESAMPDEPAARP